MKRKAFIFLLGLLMAFAVEINCTTLIIASDVTTQYAGVDRVNGESFQFRQPPGRGPGGPPQMSGERHRKRFEQLRTRKMMKMLDLDKDQEKSLRDGYYQWRQKQQMLHRSLDRLTSKLARLVRKGGDDEKLRIYTDSIRVAGTQVYVSKAAFYDQAEQLLTEKQMARLVIFQNRFEKKFFERLQQFRRRTGHPRGGFLDSIAERRRAH